VPGFCSDSLTNLDGLVSGSIYPRSFLKLALPLPRVEITSAYSQGTNLRCATSATLRSHAGVPHTQPYQAPICQQAGLHQRKPSALVTDCRFDGRRSLAAFKKGLLNSKNHVTMGLDVVPGAEEQPAVRVLRHWVEAQEFSSGGRSVDQMTE